MTGKLRLNKEKYLKQYAKKDSDEFKNMANRIETAVRISACFSFFLPVAFRPENFTEAKPRLLALNRKYLMDHIIS